jgi:hypothetical protein
MFDPDSTQSSKVLAMPKLLTSDAVTSDELRQKIPALVTYASLSVLRRPLTAVLLETMTRKCQFADQALRASREEAGATNDWRQGSG